MGLPACRWGCTARANCSFSLRERFCPLTYLILSSPMHWWWTVPQHHHLPCRAMDSSLVLMTSGPQIRGAWRRRCCRDQRSGGSNENIFFSMSPRVNRPFNLYNKYAAPMQGITFKSHGVGLSAAAKLHNPQRLIIPTGVKLLKGQDFLFFFPA